VLSSDIRACSVYVLLSPIDFFFYSNNDWHLDIIKILKSNPLLCVRINRCALGLFSARE
jgi:hypothetical protein